MKSKCDLESWIGDATDSSLSLDIRSILMAIIRCAKHYGDYLDAWAGPDGREVTPLPDIARVENIETIEIPEESAEEEKLA